MHNPQPCITPRRLSVVKRESTSLPPLALWVGPEPTVNRVGDGYCDQLHKTGFSDRIEDLDRLASLGATRVRFPVLWERTERSPGVFDWAWADARMARLRALGLSPVVGLLHHGSGPRHTSLLDPGFALKLSAFARAVAKRYPWVDAYTPVNEPLTTARFSTLYGLWYPHEANDRTFVAALLNQLSAVELAMREVRAVNPHAELVQTEDLAYTSGTWPLRYQVNFDNHRRWLTFDLLLGRVDRRHSLRTYLIEAGADEALLDRWVEQPVSPDVLGLNIYITSQRFLDHRIDRYPACRAGSNGRHCYVDLEAVRVVGASMNGFEARLREVAGRYRLPLALTEVHLGCTREEQMRWLLEAWNAAVAVRADGVDVRAVTAWAAFGAYDWDSLLTRQHGRYEPGLWDVRSLQPRPTGLARLTTELAAGLTPSHPVLQGAGWWRRSMRHLHAPHGEVEAQATSGQPLLITGATGTLGQAFARLCEERGLSYRLTSRSELDVCSAVSVRQALERWRPWAVINTAGYVRVDEAEHDPRQWRENALGPIVLGRVCGQREVRLVQFSSDLVFDGMQRWPYRESDATRPLNAYGLAKQHADRVLSRRTDALVIRSAAFFGPWDRHNFVTQGLERLSRGECWTAAVDQIVSPTYVPDLVHASLDLLIDGERGLWHVVNHGAVSWYRLACMAAEASGFLTRHVRPATDLPASARRPAYSVLASERAQLTQRIEDALQRYVMDRQRADDVAWVQVPVQEQALIHEAAGRLRHNVQRQQKAPPDEGGAFIKSIGSAVRASQS